MGNGATLCDQLLTHLKLNEDESDINNNALPGPPAPLCWPTTVSFSVLDLLAPLSAGSRLAGPIFVLSSPIDGAPLFVWSHWAW